MPTVGELQEQINIGKDYLLTVYIFWFKVAASTFLLADFVGFVGATAWEACSVSASFIWWWLTLSLKLKIIYICIVIVILSHIYDQCIGGKCLLERKLVMGHRLSKVGWFLSSPLLSLKCFHKVPIHWWMESEQASNPWLEVCLKLWFLAQ